MAPAGQAHLDYALAATVALGGILGFVRKKSVPSLLGGLAFGAAFAAAGYYIDRIDAYKGHAIGIASSATLASAMGARAVKTKKVMPSGVLAGVGTLGLVYHAKKIGEWA